MQVSAYLAGYFDACVGSLCSISTLTFLEEMHLLGKQLCSLLLAAAVECDTVALAPVAIDTVAVAAAAR